MKPERKGETGKEESPIKGSGLSWLLLCEKFRPAGGAEPKCNFELWSED